MHQLPVLSISQTQNSPWVGAGEATVQLTVGLVPTVQAGPLRSGTVIVMAPQPFTVMLAGEV